MPLLRWCPLPLVPTRPTNTQTCRFAVAASALLPISSAAALLPIPTARLAFAAAAVPVTAAVPLAAAALLPFPLPLMCGRAFRWQACAAAVLQKQTGTPR